MADVKKLLENQHHLNEAIKAIVENFTGGYPYEAHLEQMVDAQTEIVALMEMAKNQASIGRPEDEFDTDRIIGFLQAVRTYLRLLKPFTEAGFKPDKN